MRLAKSCGDKKSRDFRVVFPTCSVFQIHHLQLSPYNTIKEAFTTKVIFLIGAGFTKHTIVFHL